MLFEWGKCTLTGGESPSSPTDIEESHLVIMLERMKGV